MGYWKVGLVEGGGSLRTLEGYILSPEPTHSLPGYQEVSNLPQLFLCVMMFLACYRPEHDAASQPWTTAWSKMNLCFLISLGLAMKVWQNTGSDSIASLWRDAQLARVQVTIWWWANLEDGIQAWGMVIQLQLWYLATIIPTGDCLTREFISSQSCFFSQKNIFYLNFWVFLDFQNGEQKIQGFSPSSPSPYFTVLPSISIVCLYIEIDEWRLICN